jgi:hypothetical protein
MISFALSFPTFHNQGDSAPALYWAHVIKTYRRVKELLPGFLFFYKMAMSGQLQALAVPTPSKAPPLHIEDKTGGPQSKSRSCWEYYLPLSSIEPRLLCRPARSLVNGYNNIIIQIIVHYTVANSNSSRLVGVDHWIYKHNELRGQETGVACKMWRRNELYQQPHNV